MTPKETSPPAGSEGPASPTQSRARRLRQWVGRHKVRTAAITTLSVLASISQFVGFSVVGIVQHYLHHAPPPPAAVAAAPTVASSRPSPSPTPDAPSSTGPARPAEAAPSRQTTTAAHTGEPLAQQDRPLVTVEPVRFAFNVPAELPMCSDVGGSGAEPSSGQVLIFVRHAGQSEYFYEQPVTFPDDGRWVSRDVRLGDLPDTGRQFYLDAIRVTADLAKQIEKTCQGVPCKYTQAPGTVLATSDPITRSASAGSC
jgi:hypothetical protein